MEKLGCQGEFDPKTLILSVPPLKGWQGDDDELIDHPWWLPVLKKVVSLFTSTAISKANMESDLMLLYPLDLEEGTNIGIEGLEVEMEQANPKIQPIETDLPPPSQDELLNP